VILRWKNNKGRDAGNQMNENLFKRILIENGLKSKKIRVIKKSVLMK
jgi:hypothetical protein